MLPRADIHGDRVTVRNIRNCRYFDSESYVVDHYDKTFDLRALRGVDFMVSPFGPVPALAHTMISFEFARPDGGAEHLAVSVEVRKEKGEDFDPLRGAANQYEITYVVADERDVIGGRAKHFGEEVYLYRTRATPELARAVFEDVLERVNKLERKPEFYNLLTNNCTTNLVAHLNRIRPNRLSYDRGVLLPGLSDRKAFQEGLLVAEGPFEEVRQAAAVGERARLAELDAGFSAAIRR